MIRFFARSAIVVSARVLSIALSIIGVAVVVPYLGAENYGVFAVIQSVAAWAVLTSLGLVETNSAILTKFTPERHTQEAKGYLWASFAATQFAVVISLVAVAGIAAWLHFVAGQAVAVTASFALVVGLTLFAVPFALAQSIQNALGHTHRIAGWTLLQGAIYLALLVFIARVDLIQPEQRLVAVAFALGVSLIAVRLAMFAFTVYSAFGSIWLRVRIRQRRWKVLFQQAYPYVVINLAALMAFQVDRLVALFVMSAADVAKLDIAMKLNMAIYTAYGILLAGLWKSVGTRWVSGDFSEIRILVLRVSAVSIAFWSAVAALAYFFASPIATYWTRGAIQFDDPALFALAAFAVGLRATVDIISISLFSMRQQHRTMVAVILHGVLNVPFVIGLGGAFGLRGVVIGQFASLLLTTGWYFPLLLARATRRAPA